MKNILLTSNGLSSQKIKLAFKELFIKPIESISVLFVPTASRTADEMIYVNKSYSELIEAGVKEDNVVWFDINTVNETSKYFETVDCIFVCGGNTYYLLSKLREFGLDNKIVRAVEKGTVYVGVSAGSVIASPAINHIDFLDENDIGLSDLNALKLIDKYVVPHYEKSFNVNLADSKPFVCISDESAILYNNNITTII
ncbi:MAG: Type 1 glutamine amidotransferase-like domain-containing protein [Eubacterium sp.]|nr:Type 1 glutamine amidotransferase-like domain-containing protein [Eubacterium sp.]